MNIIQSILAIAAPVLLGALVWTFQTLAQRAWDDYERRLDLYRRIAIEIDCLFKGEHTLGKRETLMQQFRELRLLGSDEVVYACNELDPSRVVEKSHYGDLMLAFRQDLRRRRFLPPRGTTLSNQDFPIES